MSPLPLKDRAVWLIFAPLMVPIALGLGLRGKPWTYTSVRHEIDRFHRSYVIACSREKR